MKMLKRMVALATVLAMFGSASSLKAQPYCSDVGGCGYEECCASPCIAPAIALGTIALVAIIAVAVQNSSHGHGHCHN